MNAESLKNILRKKIVESFIDKILCGIDVPNYPQYRDMNEMFLEKFGGLIKTKDGYMLEKPLTVLHLHNTTDPLYWDIKSLKNC